MAKIPVTAKLDFLQAVSLAKPVPALAELIWNGFDSGSSHIHVTFDENAVGGIAAIRVRDAGDGLDPADVERQFGDLGQSWKAQWRRSNGRALHGKKGRGRFKAFALGKHVSWRSTFLSGGQLVAVAVYGDSDFLESFEIIKHELEPSTATGTEVTVETLLATSGSLRGAAALEHLARIFAPYLTEYPSTGLWVDGIKVDPGAVQRRTDTYDLHPVSAGGITHAVQLKIVEWLAPVDRVIHLCDSNGFSLHEIPAGRRVRAPGYHFTLYVASDFFAALDSDDQLGLSELHPAIQLILEDVRREAVSHFRKRHHEDHKDKVERWRVADIYPYPDSHGQSGLQLVERQLFDVLASQVEDQLPAFNTSDVSQRRLMFRLLAQAIGDDPESVRVILGEVLSLNIEQRNDLALLLKKTSLARIISSANVVAGRVDFVEGLSDLLFNKETRKTFLERDQLHKILEQESWIFREDFQLAGSEKRLEDVLEIHLAKLGERDDRDDENVLLENGVQGRVDLMFSKALRRTEGQFEYLVVELKRPSKKISSAVLSQVEAYAIGVASDSRFHQANSKWTFIVVGNEMDDHAGRKAHQANRPPGLVFDDASLSVTVWAHSWAEVLDSARSRLEFFSKQLSYQADADSSVSYLRTAHAKYLPDEVLDEKLKSRS